MWERRTDIIDEDGYWFFGVLARTALGADEDGSVGDGTIGGGDNLYNLLSSVGYPPAR